jgi:hypothetical protein
VVGEVTGDKAQEVKGAGSKEEGPTGRGSKREEYGSATGAQKRTSPESWSTTSVGGTFAPFRPHSAPMQLGAIFALGTSYEAYKG